MFAPMSPNRMHTRRVSSAMKWRRALVVLLVFVAGFAPVAKALCDYEDLASRLGTVDPSLATGAVTPSPSVPHDEDGSCCGHEPEAFATQVKVPVADGAPALSPAGAQVLAAGRALGLSVGPPGPIVRQHALAPPEPAFRRVPRLLL